MRNCKNVQYYTFGEGSLSSLAEILAPKREGNNGVIFLIDEFFEGKDLESRLPINQENDSVVFVSVKQEPHAEYIDELTEKTKTKFGEKLPGAVVGIGGGTTMDIAKAVSVLLKNPGKTEDYQGWDLVKNPGVYKIAVPTISGTGAEASRTAVLTSKKAKLGINSDYSTYDHVIMDPTFLKTVPKEQFMFTAMDCYIHCVESLFHPTLNEMTRALAEKSVQLLKQAFLEKMDYGKVMAASYLGGCAVVGANVGGHLPHPLSYGLSVVLGYRHGLATSLAFNQLEEYFPEEVKEFRKILSSRGVELPKEIMKGVSEEQLDKMAEAAFKNEKPLSAAFGEQWREIITKEKVKEIFRRM